MSERNGPSAPRRLARASNAICAGLILLAVACSTQQPPGPDESVVREFAAGGYRPIEQRAVTTTVDTWSVSGQAVSIVVSRPGQSGASALVIYLPGLGQPSEAGEPWRATWTSAGYAVMSVQLLGEDARAWSSKFARAGEFRELGLDRYAGSVMRRRMQLLAAVISEGQRRSAAGDPAWMRIDWSRVAVAGFDLGAYAAMTMAGEHVGEAERTANPLQIRAAVALSPYANPAAGAIDTRYRDIRIPVLSVTSDIDVDPLGLMDSVELRNVPFDHMTGPDKFLLSLRDVPHAQLGGSAGAVDATPEVVAARRAKDAAPQPGGGQAGQRRRNGQRGAAGDSASPGRARAGDGAATQGLSANALRMRMIAAQRISTAFLDAFVRDKPHARDWLAADASRWLDAFGTLRSK